MKINIQDILEEVYTYSPDLKKRDGELQKVIQQMIDLKPQVKIDETFKMKLRERLKQYAHISS
jgi:hypothetical protein